MTEQKHGESHDEHGGEHGSGHNLEYKVGAFDYLASATGAAAGGFGGYALYETLGLAALTAGTALSGGVGALLFAGASAIGLGYLGLKTGEIVSNAAGKKPKKEEKEQHGKGDEHAQKEAIMQALAQQQGGH